MYREHVVISSGWFVASIRSHLNAAVEDIQGWALVRVSRGLRMDTPHVGW
jgi:hypothetical protein